MNRHRFHLPSWSELLTHLPPHHFTSDTQALLAYGLVVALGAAAAVLILTGAPYAHVPMGI